MNNTSTAGRIFSKKDYGDDVLYRIDHVVYLLQALSNIITIVDQTNTPEALSSREESR